MEKEQVVQNQQVCPEQRKPKLNGIAGLKFLAVLLMFYWHSELTVKFPSLIDFGARCCEFLFVVSGFLVVYNYKRKHNNIIKETIYYSSKKLVKMWPLHIVALVAVLFIERATFSVSKIPALILNVLLLQSWSVKGNIAMSFNGVTWFLSALFFCYLLTPTLVKLCKNYKLSLVLLPILIILRLLLDKYFYTIEILPKFLSLHTSCLVRLTEFLMGMLLCPIFVKIKELIRLDNKKWFYIFSSIEIVALFGIILAMRFLVETRAFFAMLMCVVVFVFAFDKGFISKVFAFQPIKFLSKIQFEFFILHAVVIIIIESFWFKILGLNNVLLCDGIALLLLIVSCYLYKLIFEKHVDKIIKKIFNWIFKVLKLNIVV